jgi:ribosome-associated protein
MDIRKLQRAIVDGLEDVKAQNIAVFNTVECLNKHPSVCINYLRALASAKGMAFTIKHPPPPPPEET